MRLWSVLFISALTLFADAHLFVYHRFGDTRYPSTSTSTNVLKKQFEYLKTNGYEVVTLSRLAEAIENNDSIPDSWVVLTIDDNFKTFLTNGLPLFKEYGYPFTLFVYTEAAEKGYGDYMDWEDLKAVQKYGELGFHGHGHLHMTHASDDTLKRDFRTGLDLMRERLGIVPFAFAYPYGEYDGRIKALAKAEGFRIILNQNAGAVGSRSPLDDLDRTALTGEFNLPGKLKTRYLEARWLVPKIWPPNDFLDRVRVECETAQTRGELYVSGHGWQPVKIQNGIVDTPVGVALVKRRSRVILKLPDSTMATKIYVKPKEERDVR